MAEKKLSLRPWIWLTALPLAAALILACAAPDSHAGESSKAVSVSLPGGHRIYNLLPAFIAYGEQGRALDAAGRLALWDRLLEKHWPDYFNQLIYRNFTGQRRERIKAALVNQFWSEVAPGLNRLRAMNQTGVQRLLGGLGRFKKAFPDFKPGCDFYLTVSFSFNGKVGPLNGQKVLSLGLEKFDPKGPELDITIAHELFHIYHFAAFSTAGGLYRGVWAEGLATYASAMVVPGHRLSSYLGFSGERMNHIHDNYQPIVRFIADHLDSTDRAVKRACLGMEDNQLGVPPGCGYFIGFDVVGALIKRGESLPALARWNPATVRRNMARTLPTLGR